MISQQSQANLLNNHTLDLYLATWNMASFPSQVRQKRMQYGANSLNSVSTCTSTFSYREILSIPNPNIRLSSPFSGREKCYTNNLIHKDTCK